MSPRSAQNNLHKSFPDRATAWIGSVSSLVVHTGFFLASFISILLGAKAESVMLILTTVVSLEAIYLAIFIQISVNRNTLDIADIQDDVADIAEDVEDIADDVEGIEKDIEEIQADVEGIEADIEDISDDVEGIGKDIDEIAEDIEDIEESIDEDTETDPELTKSQSYILESLLNEIKVLNSKFEQLEQKLTDTDSTKA